MEQEELAIPVVAGALRPHLEGTARCLDRYHPHAAREHVVATGVVVVVDRAHHRHRISPGATGGSNCRATHATLVVRGAMFLTEPVEYKWEIRTFFRDPDGHLLEIGESKR
jgi:catechol 2,3-dioxygenase-like lactoylglutathione lyase family enzyme